MITINLYVDSHEIEQLTIALESSDVHTRNGPDVAALLDRVHAAARAATKGGTPSTAETPPPPSCCNPHPGQAHADGCENEGGTPDPTPELPPRP